MPLVARISRGGGEGIKSRTGEWLVRALLFNDRQPFSMSGTYEWAWLGAIWEKRNLAGVAHRTQGATKMRFFIVRHRGARKAPPFSNLPSRGHFVPPSTTIPGCSHFSKVRKFRGNSNSRTNVSFVEIIEEYSLRYVSLSRNLEFFLDQQIAETLIHAIWHNVFFSLQLANV